MSSLKKRNFHLWFSKLRCFPAIVKPSSPPQTPNKKSLSITHLENSDYSSISTAADDGFFSDDSTSDSDAIVPDFSAAVASHRFFFSSPGCSNSIFDSSPDTHHGAAVHGGVEVRKVSMDPFVDFRASMQEMVEARDRPVDVRRDWEYLQELLLCYLQINPGDTHKFILRAFSDLVVYLLETSPESFSDHHLRPHNINSNSWGRKRHIVVGEKGGWNVCCKKDKNKLWVFSMIIKHTHTHSLTKIKRIKPKAKAKAWCMCKKRDREYNIYILCVCLLFGWWKRK